ncbi:GPN-loop GTPase 1 [Gracilariopsis chorda]|uniref:GPN-loop GTPase n=1 Tax=Gracilariopsis chorda TaxID=448386 RepID=A0A2V3IN06_9FLOR|nr:GPN-loop GTPase 1 [Gracilariopsis chorda]|eukprot:PXF43452.1 GPN-loop GTPase 1 [Gracilariopsis chorda]
MSASLAQSGAASAQHDARITTPACLVLGMAGSGKTTLVDALSAWLDVDSVSSDDEPVDDAQLNQQIVDAIHSMSLNQASSVAPPARPSAPSAQPPAHDVLPGQGAYVINLDPAVYELPYDPNIDIRDTIKYKQVMSQYSLGPNGAIITSLNLYATRFDQVLTLIEKRAPQSRAVIIDTPGQIETFTWSASGTIITDALGITLPTVILFVVDTVRCENTMTFVSNMLYACSIMYKTRLPMIIVFNKTDVKSCHFAQQWMSDFDKLENDLKENNFLGTLARSMAQALEQFYHTLRSVAVSAETGDGMDQLVKCIQDAAEQYENDYRPVVDARKKARAQGKKEHQDEQIERIRKDMYDEPGFGTGPRFDEEDESDHTGSDQQNDGMKPSSSVFPDKHAVRMAKMTGTYYDKQEEQRKYDQFIHNMDASNPDSKRDRE